MKKQVDFAVRLLTLNQGGINGGFTSQGATQKIMTEHPFSDGWEIESIQHVQLSADGVSVLLLLVKYETDTVSVKTPDAPKAK
jgi:hypothetical protein